MGTLLSTGGDSNGAGSIFLSNQDEAINKDGHQNWHRLIVHEFGDGKLCEGVIHKYQTWSEPSLDADPLPRGVRGQGDLERNRERAARRAKRKIRFACKSGGFDRMVTRRPPDLSST
jgi:hypothetical protein